MESNSSSNTNTTNNNSATSIEQHSVLAISGFFNQIFQSSRSPLISLNIPVLPDGVIQIISDYLKPSFAGSTILSQVEEGYLLGLLTDNDTLPPFATINLLLRGSVHGFSANTFHQRCDYKPNTVLIVQTNQTNHVFGGYTPCQWESSNNYVRDNSLKSFIFLLRSQMAKYKSIIPKKWNLNEGKENKAVSDDVSHGCIYGDGYDILLFDKCNLKNRAQALLHNSAYGDDEGDDDHIWDSTDFYVKKKNEKQQKQKRNSYLLGMKMDIGISPSKSMKCGRLLDEQNTKQKQPNFLHKN